MVGRKEEFRADAYAVELGTGAGLFSFLEKIEGTKGSPKGIRASFVFYSPKNKKRLI
ncbi:hypothetical protein [Bacillus cereus]|uniref:hypothetical protein n=1 Tax=Bacillus cereus TaxID=1396 RepID=UPI00065A5F17|nr:hypothetical protein [Bacillus cereus]KLA35387.1 hypothetical protein B4080_3300 [Bacillus cereus]